MDLYTVRKQLSMGIPLTNISLRVTDYVRVSTNHIEQKKSLKNQIDHFEDMIKHNSNWTYIEGYVDEGISGVSVIKRDNFLKMIEDAKNNKFDLIITKEISRFSRNTLDSIKYTRELLNYGVAVLFLNDNINTALPDSELRLTIMASMAQDEIRRLSERVKFGMNRSIMNGVILGNDKLYGYKKDKNTGNLKIVLEEALVIKRLFNMYAIDLLSISKIVSIFKKENIRTSLNKKWNVTTITRMIKNPKYMGYYCGKKSEVIDYMSKKVRKISKKDWIFYEDNLRIPPIVSKEIWQRANERLEKRSKSKTKYENRYSLSCKIYCGNDGEVFHRRKQCKVSDDITWVCAGYLKYGKKYCNMSNIRESELRIIFNDLVYYLGIDYMEFIDFLFSFYKGCFDRIILEEKIKSKIQDKLIEILIKKIVVFKDSNGLLLKFYFNYDNNLNISKAYEFKRGYNTICTRRYVMKYLVEVI